MQFLFGS